MATPRDPRYLAGRLAHLRCRRARIACRGIDERKDGAHTVTLLGASIVYQGARVVPEVGDAIEIGGYQVEVGTVEVDPAAAAYTCTAAGAARSQR